MSDYYHVHANALGRASIVVDGLIRLRVTGESMFPLLTLGDMLLVSPIRLDLLHRGDIIVAQYGNELVTHRLIKIDTHGCILKGDQLAKADPKLHFKDMLGIVIGIERGDRRADFHSRRWMPINRFLGWLGWLEYSILYMLEHFDNETADRRYLKDGLRNKYFILFMRLPFRIIRRLVLMLGIWINTEI
jgi:signal peptidase I